MSAPNLLLDALIEEAGLSHSSLAARLNKVGESQGLVLCYDHASVARWIRDGATPRAPVPDLICQVLSPRVGRSLDHEDIGMVRSRRPGGPGPSLRHVAAQARSLWRGDLRQVHRSLVEADGVVDDSANVASIFDWQNASDDTLCQESSPGQMSALGILRTARDRYEQMYRRVGGTPVRPRILECLNTYAAPLVREVYDNKAGRQVFRVVGSLVALTGICAYDTDRQALAQRYYLHALRMAKASGDWGFGGYVVGLLTTQAMHMGKYRHVVQYAEAALRAGRGNLPPALATDLFTLQAKATARMGDRRRCHVHMREAETTAAKIETTGQVPEAGFVQPGLLECQLAEALRQLGDLRAAQTYAEHAVQTAPAAHVRGQAHRLATLALVMAASGEPERAAHITGQMLNLTEGMESGRIRDRLATVVDALRVRCGTSEVDSVIERASSQLAAPY